MKLAAIIALAAWLAGPEERVRSFALGLIPFVAFMGMLSVLILRQPDLGTTLVLLLVATTMFFLAGADLKLMATLTVGGTATVLALAVGSKLPYGPLAVLPRSLARPLRRRVSTSFSY